MATNATIRSHSLFRDVQVAVVAVLLVGVAVYVVITTAHSTEAAPNYSALLSFLPSALVTTVALLLEVRRRPYSLHLMHLLAVAVLFILAPLVQTIQGVYPGGFQAADSDVALANLCIFIWVVAYVAGEWLFRHRFGAVRARLPFLERNLSLASLGFGTLLATATLSYLAYRGTAGALTRAAFGEAYAATSTMDLSMVKIARAAPLIVLAGWLMLIALFPRRRTWAVGGVCLFLFLGNLVFNNPLAAARYWTLTIAMAFACVLHLRKTATATLLFPGAMVGVLLMPSLNVGRTRTDFDMGMLAVREGATSPSLLAGGDFDAYINLAMTNKLIDLHGVTHGHQLLGALLFWVPRAWWHDKPTGSGAYAAEMLNLPWANIASPLPAEALINFGIFGIAPCAVVFAGILYLADSRYYLNRTGAPPELFRPLDVVYPFWLGLVVFATRGDLINGFSFAVALTFAGVVSLRLFNSPPTPQLP